MARRQNNQTDGVYRKTRQRERILELLKSTKAHPAAEWIYTRLKKELPKLSLGTVYRNLGILQRQGLIKRVDFENEFDRFDAHVETHYHFVCESCGAIIDLDTPVREELNGLISRLTPHKALHHQIQFYGTCARCTNHGKRA